MTHSILPSLSLLSSSSPPFFLRASVQPLNTDIIVTVDVNYPKRLVPARLIADTMVLCCVGDVISADTGALNKTILLRHIEQFQVDMTFDVSIDFRAHDLPIIFYLVPSAFVS